MSAPLPSTFSTEFRNATPASLPNSSYGSECFTTAGRLPSVDLMPAAAYKRARVIGSPIATGNTAAHLNDVSLHLRRRATSIGATPPAKVLQSQHSFAHSPQSKLSPDTKMAAHSTTQLTANLRSPITCTPLPRSMGSLPLPVNNPPTGMPLTPPRLLTPGFGIKDAVSTHSVAGALEKLLSVTEGPIATRNVPGPTPLSSSSSPQHHCMSSQLHQRGPRFAPTPCSTPHKPVASQANSAAVISAYSGHRAHGKAQDKAFTTNFFTPLSAAESLSTKAVCHLSMFTSTTHSSTPRSQIHQGLGSIVCPPNGLSPTGSFPESAPTCNGAGAAAFHQHGEHLKDNLTKAHQPTTVGMNDALLDAVACKPECPSGSVSLSATFKSPSSAVAAPTMPTPLQVDAVNGSEDTTKAEDPMSSLPPVADMPKHQERCTRQDAGHAPRCTLKSASVSADIDEFGVPGLLLPRMEHGMDEVDNNSNDGSKGAAMDRMHAVSNAMRGSCVTEALTTSEPTSTLDLAKPAVMALAPASRTWNMHDGHTESSPVFHVSLNNVGIRGSTARSLSMSPADRVLIHYHLLPDSDPISSPSKWDAEDPVSIYKPQNLCFMPSFSGGGAHFTSTTFNTERMHAKASSSQQLTSQDMQHCKSGAGLGVALPDDQAITWYPWQLPEQTHVRLCKHLKASPLVVSHLTRVSCF
jgi:hypothetical protein